MKRKKTSISVIVPKNPFVAETGNIAPCLCALDVDSLMEWWPGMPHYPILQAEKVKTIQRSLDWKRVASIAAYLLQEEIVDASSIINKYFSSIYKPKESEPGREWPPKTAKVTGYQQSIYPVFSNILVHANGVKFQEDASTPGAAKITIDSSKKDFNLTVIDGQHRINGAFLALKIRRESHPEAEWQIPCEIFLDLDELDHPPRHQAQIFIDINFYQKKVDRSLVADLFPTARGRSGSLNDESRAQDIGRLLMLEKGPLVGMIQIPGIKYGVKNVITLSTLVSAIKGVLPELRGLDLTSLSEQLDFIVQALEAWLVASGKMESIENGGSVSPSNVVYQGRVLVTVVNLIPAISWRLKRRKFTLISDKSKAHLERWLVTVIEKAGFLDKSGEFIDKNVFKEEGFLGSGGIGRFRDRLWAATSEKKRNLKRMRPDSVSRLADEQRALVHKSIGA